MAIDECLLKDSDLVLIRDYQWSEPSVSIGHFGISSEALTICHREVSRPLVRRPTGGGLVEHGHGLDYTYSIVIPAAVTQELELSPKASYRAIHGALAVALQQSGVAAEQAAQAPPGTGGQACFTNPVGDDLMLGQQKIAGAGQKRSRGAILHQGSVQPLELPPQFGQIFASQLGMEVIDAELSASTLEAASQLAEEKYRDLVEEVSDAPLLCSVGLSPRSVS